MFKLEFAVFDPIAYEAFSHDVDYVSAQKEHCAENYAKALSLNETVYNKENLLAGVILTMLHGEGYGAEIS